MRGDRGGVPPPPSALHYLKWPVGGRVNIHNFSQIQQQTAGGCHTNYNTSHATDLFMLGWMKGFLNVYGGPYSRGIIYLCP